MKQDQSLSSEKLITSIEDMEYPTNCMTTYMQRTEINIKITYVEIVIQFFQDYIRSLMKKRESKLEYYNMIN